MIKYLHPFFLFFCLFSVGISLSQNTAKIAYAFRTQEIIKIDAFLNEEAWDEAQIINGFRQYDPYFDVSASQKTIVKILYDDDAMYVGAFMFDTAPDSILKQLGNRDASLNADAFGFSIDTYNNQNDAYTFEISASGVQTDYRTNDTKFNAVWESAVRITEEGWIAELRIPYAAIRFPKKDKQLWRIQFYRNLRRSREWSQWALESKDHSNKSKYWGELRGVENINPPLRLSISPYLSANAEHFPYNEQAYKNTSVSYSGGLDLKWGLNESYTLDITLLPDFSHVQSDNQIKNLTAFETVYDENRPFFQEAVDLFNKNNLFYSRRIGRTPQNYYKLDNLIDSNEYILSNPFQVKLLNATKISGRSKKGLALGIFNAVTDNMYAEVENEQGHTRKILTEPLSNYNVAVIDKAFKNNSSVYIMNTSVFREGAFNKANVVAGGVNILNRSNYYRLILRGAQSNIIKPNENNQNGQTYYMSAAKVKGNFLFSFARNVLDDTYNCNDMGLMYNNNQVDNSFVLNYNIYEPFGYFLYLRTALTYRNDYHFITQKKTNNNITFNIGTNTKNYLSLWGNINTQIEQSHDYYEARTDGLFFLRPLKRGGVFNFSSDYRRKIALDGSVELVAFRETKGFLQTYKLMPIFRTGDKFSFNVSCALSKQINDIGFVAKKQDSILFGNRDIRLIENIFSGQYVIKNDLSLNFKARHYWITGRYNQFYVLQNTGLLHEVNTFALNYDFNFNSLLFEVFLNWQFAPGSHLSFVWKNSLLEENNIIVDNYFNNFSNTLNYPQLNTWSLKVLYYIDYQKVKKIFV